ncbi:hypothetical protein NHP190003_15410 [Helicobacter sp. NHP19-003]|uniref:Uncharacterized protein n=1 Tax=Helicobacter gastrocanis TaxID=2849641 RepID=A0ABN6I6P1_9HELI|nr:hypothetical protein [Helicobacter sp. NHP19-003]BCZ18259.1 hypothetical protein NHP190003_15410 [Helicobacter sp. NHP19-003]
MALAHFVGPVKDSHFIRADLKPYDPKILTGARGCGGGQDKQEGAFVPLKTPLVARNPKADTKEGLMGIDFGTTNTMVAHQEENAQVYFMRIGTENPTIINFNDLTCFLENHNAQARRPNTKWADVSVAHRVCDDMNQPPSIFDNLF